MKRLLLHRHRDGFERKYLSGQWWKNVAKFVDLDSITPYIRTHPTLKGSKADLMVLTPPEQSVWWEMDHSKNKDYPMRTGVHYRAIHHSQLDGWDVLPTSSPMLFSESFTHDEESGRYGFDKDQWGAFVGQKGHDVDPTPVVQKGWDVEWMVAYVLHVEAEGRVTYFGSFTHYVDGEGQYLKDSAFIEIPEGSGLDVAYWVQDTVSYVQSAIHLVNTDEVVFSPRRPSVLTQNKRHKHGLPVRYDQLILTSAN